MVKRYLVHIRIKGPITPSRIKVSTKAAVDVLTKLALTPQELLLAYASSDAGSFGCLIKTTDYAKAIRTQLNTDPHVTAEQILIVEVGEEFASANLGKAQGWLEHH